MSSAHAALAGRRILVAEDDPLMQFMLGDVLEEAGIVVTLAGDGAAAVTQAQEAAPAYDWVLMDAVMPRMDGLEATRQLRADARTAGLCIIGLSGNDDAASRAASRAAGMNDFLAKPVDPAQLLDCLREWLGRPATPSMATAETAAAAAATPAFDLTRLDELGNGDSVRIKKYADHFLTALHASAGELLQALADNRLDTLAGLAHRMKSTARWVGAVQLGDIFAAVEQAAKAGRAENLPALLDACRTAGADFSLHLQDHLERLNTGAPR
jgi:CheY-like chemotaxis protein